MGTWTRKIRILRSWPKCRAQWYSNLVFYDPQSNILSSVFTKGRSHACILLHENNIVRHHVGHAFLVRLRNLLQRSRLETRFNPHPILLRNFFFPNPESRIHSFKWAFMIPSNFNRNNRPLLNSSAKSPASCLIFSCDSGFLHLIIKTHS